MLQYMPLLPETKGSCAHVLLIAACLSDMSTCINCHLQTEETYAKLLAKSTSIDS